jgi:hypothetical protein
MPYLDPAKHRESRRNSARRNKDWFFEYKNTLSCIDCGFSHGAAIHFHHLRDKVATIATMVNKGVKREAIMTEIEKCIPLCANCHALRHYNEDYHAARNAQFN